MTRTAETASAPPASPTETPQAEEIRKAEALLGGVPIRTGAAFVIDGEVDVARLAAAWTRCGDRISLDSDGRRLFAVEPLRPPSGAPVSNPVRESRDRAALAAPTDAALFSRLHRLTDGSTVWSMFAHHSVLDGVGLVHFMSVVRESYLDTRDAADALSWPYSTWEDSRWLAVKMFKHQGKAEARVLDLIDGGRPAPVLVGPKRREPTAPRIARLGQIRPASLPGTGAQASLAWLCGYTAVLLFAATGESRVQLSVPRAGVSRMSAQPLGSFAYTLPLVVPHPEGKTVAGFLDAIASDIRYNRWSQCFRSGSLRRSFGPNVNLFPVDLAAGTDVRGARWCYDLIASGPVEDVDIVCAFDGDAHDVRAQVGMAGLTAADFRRVESALRAVLADFANTDADTSAAEVVRRARGHLAPLAGLNRELAASAGIAGNEGEISDEAAVRSIVAGVLRARYGSSSDPEEYDFFETGGSSLDAVNLAEEISAALGHSLDPATLYYHPTFDELVASVADTGSDTGRWPGWSSAGFFLLDIGIADGGTADTRCEVLTRLLGQMPLAWRKGPNAGPSGDHSDGGDTVPVLDATDRAAELVTTVGDAGLLSLRAEWPLGSAVVRLSVRAERATPEADALDAVARAAAASGLGTIVHSVFGEMFAA
jgi:Phosphopantetheine attachment site